MADPTVVPAPAPAKPGYKSTEFWLTVAAVVVGLLTQSGVIPADSPASKLIAQAAAILALLGYQVVRTVAKTSGQPVPPAIAPFDPTKSSP